MDKYTEELEVINTVLYHQTKKLVGILCKRVEVLDGKDTLNPDLYKALVKELVWEHYRALKQLINIHLTIGTVKFIKPKDK